METPRDKLITAKSKGGTVKGIVHWSSDFGPRKTNAFLLAQKFVDSEVLRCSDPLTPRMNGDLIKAGARTTRIGEGLVQYADPKARYLYYGKVMVGRAPKTVTDKPLVYDGAPTRGAFWFERMKAKDKKTILKGAGKIAGK
ncbi:MAG: minor capsid protein [[Clostridium] innocuum]